MTVSVTECVASSFFMEFCQTTEFCRHPNTRHQSDAQQFWRQDLCHCRTTSLEQSAAQSQTMSAVIRPVQAVTEDIFIQTVRPQRSVNCSLTAPNRNILNYFRSLPKRCHVANWVSQTSNWVMNSICLYHYTRLKVD